MKIRDHISDLGFFIFYFYTLDTVVDMEQY